MRKPADQVGMTVTWPSDADGFRAAIMAEAVAVPLNPSLTSEYPEGRQTEAVADQVCPITCKG